ncbi:hypothetical protein ACP4OV_020153 [Aristida adscensionis]
MATPTFQIETVAAPTEYSKFTFRNLYMHRIGDGAGVNQTTILDKGYGFGHIAVNNWTIYDGPGTAAKLVARGQGLHINGGDWRPSFSIVFEKDSSFKGSTLEVAGVHMDEGQWAIVGGTGQFAFASGVMTMKHIDKGTGRNVDEITLEGLCPLLKGSPTLVTKIGPWGGSGGTDFDVTKPPHRLVSVTIRSGDYIDALGFSYVDQAGDKHDIAPWGGSGGRPDTILLEPTEFVKELSGTTDNNLVSSLTFVTNVRTYGPFGKVVGTPFSVPLPGNGSIVGFFGRTGALVDAIGVYVRGSAPV